MNRNIIIALLMVMAHLGWSQSAEPALSGANFVPNSIKVGETSTLTISFANSGFDPIPAQSVELTISSAFEYYLMESNPPGGLGGAMFSWVYLGTDVWRGTNINAIPAFGGGDIIVQVTGVAVSPAFEATNINIQPVANLNQFENAPGNDNLQPELRVTAATCFAGTTSPNLSASAISNNCPSSLSVDLDLLHSGSTPTFSSLIWSTEAALSGGPSSQINPVVTTSGAYYAYYYDSSNDCYSPVSTVVNVTISDCNTAPTANNDNVDGFFNSEIIIDVLNNDDDPENGDLTISIVGTSSQGSVPTVTEGKISYTPPSGFIGIDQFTYRICDDGTPPKCDEATVTIEVHDLLSFNNQCPNEYVDIDDIHEGSLPDGNVLVWSTDSDESDGVDNILPERVFTSDTVYVYYYDSESDCYSPGTRVYLNVESCNNPPIANNSTISGDEDAPYQGDLSSNDSDPDGDELIYSVVDSPDNGSLTLNPDGTYTYLPNEEFVGTDEFTYQVCDDATPQRCDTATVSITVDPVDFVCVNIDAKVLLEGMLINPEGQLEYLQEMRTDMNDLRLLPGQSFADGFSGTSVYSPKGQPYDVRPWLYDGDEGDQFDSQGDPNNGNAGYPATTVDWVLVSLRENVDDTPQSIVCQEAVLLHKDGTLEMVSPCCGVDRRKEYFVVVEHRNHLIIMSPQKVDMTRTGAQLDDVKYSVFHDFTLSNSYKTIDPNFSTEIGFGQKQIPDGRWIMIGGNAEQKYTQDDTDLTVDDEVIWGIQNSNVSLYKIGDFNLNGDINFNDRVIWEENNGLFSSVPRDKNQ